MRKLLLLACMLSAAACAPDLASQPDEGGSTADNLQCDSSAKATCDDNTLEYCDATTGDKKKVDCTATNGKICGSDAQFGASCQSAGTKTTDTPCGAITTQGICQGSKKVFCDTKSNTQKQVDCAANGGECATTKSGASCQEVGKRTPSPDDGCGSVTAVGECGWFGWSASYCSKSKLVSNSCSGDKECIMPGDTGSCDSGHAACCSPPAPTPVETCTTNYRRCEGNVVMKCVVGQEEEEEDCDGVFFDDICREAGAFGSCDSTGAACCSEDTSDPDPDPDPEEPTACASGVDQTYCDGNILVTECNSLSEDSIRYDCDQNWWDDECEGSAIFGNDYWDGTGSAACN